MIKIKTSVFFAFVLSLLSATKGEASLRVVGEAIFPAGAINKYSGFSNITPFALGDGSFIIGDHSDFHKKLYRFDNNGKFLNEFPFHASWPEYQLSPQGALVVYDKLANRYPGPREVMGFGGKDYSNFYNIECYDTPYIFSSPASDEVIGCSTSSGVKLYSTKGKLVDKNPKGYNLWDVQSFSGRAITGKRLDDEDEIEIRFVNTRGRLEKSYRFPCSGLYCLTLNTSLNGKTLVLANRDSQQLLILDQDLNERKIPWDFQDFSSVAEPKTIQSLSDGTLVFYQGISPTMLGLMFIKPNGKVIHIPGEATYGILPLVKNDFVYAVLSSSFVKLDKNGAVVAKVEVKDFYARPGKDEQFFYVWHNYHTTVFDDDLNQIKNFTNKSFHHNNGQIHQVAGHSFLFNRPMDIAYSLTDAFLLNKNAEIIKSVPIGRWVDAIVNYPNSQPFVQISSDSVAVVMSDYSTGSQVRVFKTSDFSFYDINLAGSDISKLIPIGNNRYVVTTTVGPEGKESIKATIFENK